MKNLHAFVCSLQQLLYVCKEQRHSQGHGRSIALRVGITCCVHSSFAIILKRKRMLVALLLLSYRCIVSINVLWLFLVVPWVGRQCVIVVFPDHTHLLWSIYHPLLVQMLKMVVIRARIHNTVKPALSGHSKRRQKIGFQD